MVQPDLKKLVAYSSVSHLGFVMLGIFAFTTQAMQGAILQMINHGLSTGALFLLVGMIYERRHTRMIDDFGGLWRVVPAFSVVLLIVSLSSIGLPGLNGFVGEFLILVGTFRVNVPYAVLATTGIILAAVYMLWMLQRVAFGPVRDEANSKLQDLTPGEYATLLPLLLFIVWIGIYPEPFLRTTQGYVKQLLTQVGRTAVSTQQSAISPGVPLAQTGASQEAGVSSHQPSAISHQPGAAAATAEGAPVETASGR
jgi:NADH-quinone oxidoreductase subunit M